MRSYLLQRSFLNHEKYLTQLNRNSSIYGLHLSLFNEEPPKALKQQDAFLEETMEEVRVNTVFDATKILGKIVSEVKKESKNLGKYKRSCLLQAEDLLSKSKVAQLRFLFPVPIPYSSKMLENMKVGDIDMPPSFAAECKFGENLCFWGGENDTRGSAPDRYTGEAFLKTLLADLLDSNKPAPTPAMKRFSNIILMLCYYALTDTHNFEQLSVHGSTQFGPAFTIQNGKKYRKNFLTGDYVEKSDNDIKAERLQLIGNHEKITKKEIEEITKSIMYVFHPDPENYSPNEDGQLKWSEALIVTNWIKEAAFWFINQENHKLSKTSFHGKIPALAISGNFVNFHSTINSEVVGNKVFPLCGNTKEIAVVTATSAINAMIESVKNTELSTEQESLMTKIHYRGKRNVDMDEYETEEEFARQLEKTALFDTLVPFASKFRLVIISNFRSKRLISYLAFLIKFETSI